MSRGSRPTQVDVARLAGVSRQTVSLVVRDDPRVAEKSRRSVREAMRALGYYPNMAARVLAAHTTRVVGVVIAQLTNPFNAELAEALRGACERVGLVPFVSPVSDERGDVLVAVRRFLQLGVDGLLLVSPLATDEELDEIGRQVPTVVLIRNAGPASVDLVRVDDAAGGRLVAEHLVASGYCPVVHVGSDRYVHGDSTSERRAGYRLVMASIGQEPMEISMDGADLKETIARLVVRNRRFALCCHNDVTAFAATGCIRALGLRPGANVGITGFDDTSISSLPGIGLTTIHAGIPDIARCAVDVLGERCEGRRQPRDVVLPHSLVVRGSSRCPDNID